MRTKRAKMAQESFKSTVLTIALLAFICSSAPPVINANDGKQKYISEFTLDELTNADSGYQPINFATHYGLRNGQQHPNRPQMRERAVTVGRHTAANMKRAGGTKTCHPTEPFLCPSDDPQGGECIPIQYLCDGSSDCPASTNSPGGYDEDPLLCTAAKRPPVEETANFLRTLITNHGPHYIEKLFGPNMNQVLDKLGGPERVAIALSGKLLKLIIYFGFHIMKNSVSKTIEDFGKALHLMRADIDHLRNVLVAVQTMDGPMLKNLGIVRNSELADMKFFLEKLLSTGFLD